MKTIPLHKPPLKLKINLENMPHPVYRRVLVPEDINMLQLHYVIQLAVGWEGDHLFQFQDKRYKPTFVASDSEEVYVDGEEDPFFDFYPKELPVEKVSLKDVFLEELEGKPVWYWYDFGDDWWHKITFQKVTKKDLKGYQGRPVCVEAFGACPPEDIGGPWGYHDWLEAIMDKKHPEHRERREWAGMPLRFKYDPDFADIEAINGDLEALPESEAWNFSSENYFDE